MVFLEDHIADVNRTSKPQSFSEVPFSLELISKPTAHNDHKGVREDHYDVHIEIPIVDDLELIK